MNHSDSVMKTKGEMGQKELKRDPGFVIRVVCPQPRNIRRNRKEANNRREIGML